MEQEFLKSLFCYECGGKGYTVENGVSPSGQKIKYHEQCQSCEEIHRLEVRADRMVAEAFTSDDIPF